MRSALPLAVLLSFLLVACAAKREPTKAVDQSGTLKVHPGLVGQPVPPELQTQETPAKAPN